MAYLTRAWARRSLLVEIAGLEERYISAGTVGSLGQVSDYLAGTADIPFTTKAVITSKGSYTWAMDPAGGVVAYEPMVVTLATDGPIRRRAADPAHALGRKSELAASWFGKLITNISADAATPDIEVDRAAPGSWSYPRIIHVDGEAFRVTAFGGSGTAMDPYVFTVSHRAVGLTRQTAHLVDTTAPIPLVTAEIIAWKGRPVRLLVAERFKTGGHGPWRELMHGVLADEPETRGTRIKLQVAPLTTLVDVELGKTATDNSVFGLVDGAHLFQPPIGCAVEAGILVSMRNNSPVEPVQEVRLVQAFIRTEDDGEGVVAWPSEAKATVNPAWAQTDPGDADDPPLILKISGEADAAIISVKQNDAVAFRTSVFLWSDPAAIPDFGDFLETFDDSERSGVDELCIGFDFADPNSDSYPNRALTPILANVRDRFGRRAVPGGEWIRGLDGPGVTWTTAAERTIRLRDIPSAFYQRFEPKMLVTADPAIPTGGYASLAITFFDRALSDVETVVVRVTDSEAVDLPSGATGYAVTIHEDDRALLPDIANWTGYQPVSIEQTLVFRDVAPGRIVLELLESGTGEGVNGDYDVHPFGAGIPAAYIDEDSFLSFVPPPGFEGWSPVLPRGEKLRKLVDSILQTLGAAISLVTSDDGVCRLTLVRIGPASADHARGTITASHFTANDPGETNRDTRVINRVEIRVPLVGGGEETLEFRNNAAIDRLALETHTLKLDLRATTPVDAVSVGDLYSDLRPVAARIFFELSRSRAIWEGTVNAGALLFAQPAAVYLFTSPRLEHIDGTVGVVDAAARIISASLDLDAGTATFEASHHGARIAGWNASLRATGEVDGTTLEVETNYYSSPIAPDGSAQVDLSGFAVGDVVRVGPLGDDDAAVQRTVVSIDIVSNPHQIELDGAHGLSAPHWGDIWPDAYDDASARHKQLAYLADSDGVLGTDNDPGVVIG